MWMLGIALLLAAAGCLWGAQRAPARRACGTRTARSVATGTTTTTATATTA